MNPMGRRKMGKIPPNSSMTLYELRPTRVSINAARSAIQSSLLRQKMIRPTARDTRVPALF
jgi:hypothetical protein